MPTPPRKRPFSMHPPRASPKSLPNPKRSLSGVPGPSPEAPERSPRAPRAPLERPRDASGAPPELARSAQRVQQGTGDLKTAPWDLKKLTPEASGTSFWSPRGLCFVMFLYVRWPQLADAAPNRTSQFPGGGGESPQASSIIRRPLAGVSDVGQILSTPAMQIGPAPSASPRTLATRMAITGL